MDDVSRETIVEKIEVEEHVEQTSIELQDILRMSLRSEPIATMLSFRDMQNITISSR